MKQKTALEIAIKGSFWLEKCIQDNGRFIYGYDYKTMQKRKDYNILRHLGSIWAMLEVYKVHNNKRLFETVIRSLTYVDNHYIDKAGDTYSVAEDGYIKLGGNGLAVLAYLSCYNQGGPDWMLERAKGLAGYIVTCINTETGLFRYHKRNYATKKDKGFVSEFYPGEALFALAEIAKINAPLSFIETIRLTFQAYAKLREQAGQIRDHWMMQALESFASLLKASEVHTELLPYAKAILNKSLKDAPSKKTGPTACRSECILSYIRFLRVMTGGIDTEEKDSLMEVVNQQLNFQARSYIPRGLSEGAFRHSPTSSGVRNDYCQHNISSFIGYFHLSQ